MLLIATNRIVGRVTVICVRHLGPDSALNLVRTMRAEPHFEPLPWVLGTYAVVTAIRLGLAFELRPGWKIYWRSPGDAGLPPTIDSTSLLTWLTRW